MEIPAGCVLSFLWYLGEVRLNIVFTDLITKQLDNIRRDTTRQALPIGFPSCKQRAPQLFSWLFPQNML